MVYLVKLHDITEQSKEELDFTETNSEVKNVKETLLAQVARVNPTVIIIQKMQFLTMIQIWQ
jgi:hypothetical protein